MLYLGWAHDVLVDARGCGDPHEALMGQGHRGRLLKSYGMVDIPLSHPLS